MGKTTACRSYVARHPDVLYLNAGELIKQAASLSDEALRTAGRSEILEHQLLLGDALNARLAGRDIDVLIDAHSIIDNGHEIVPVTVEIVASLRPTGLILLEASPREIQRRRHLDGRERPERSDEELRSQMVLTREFVEGYSRSLEIPLQIAVTSNEFELDPLVEALQ